MRVATPLSIVGLLCCGGSAAGQAPAPAPLSIAVQPLAAPPLPLSPLEMEACRRMREQAENPAPSGAEMAGATAGAVAGQAAGATVGGPVGAALGGLVLGKAGKSLVGVTRKMVGADGDKDAPKPGRPDPLLLTECEARNPSKNKPAPDRP